MGLGSESVHECSYAPPLRGLMALGDAWEDTLRDLFGFLILTAF